MNTKIPKFLFNLIVTVLLTLGLSLSLQSLLAAWTAPTATPPDGNTPGPIFNSGTFALPVVGSSLGVLNNLTVGGSITSGGNPICVDSGSGCGSGGSSWATATNGTSIYYNNGNVGIGTDNPQFALDIQRTDPAIEEILRISSNNETKLQIDSANNTSILNPLIESRRSRGTIAEPSPVQNNDTIFEIWGLGYNQNDMFEVAGQISILADGNPSGDSVPGKIAFATTELGTSHLAHTAPTRRMTIKSNGNVGIGTDNPTGILEVAQNLFIYNNGGSNTGGYPKCPCDTDTAKFDCDHRFFTSSISGDYCYDHVGTWYAYFQRDTSYSTFLVSSNGHVGIGTDNPREETEIKGNNVLFSDSSVEMIMDNTDPVSDWMMDFYDDFKLKSGSYGGSWTTRLYVKKDGNIGIGTDNPNQKLEISSVMRLTPTDDPGICNPSRKGSIYYDISVNGLCDCNGSSWAQVDGGGGC